MAGGISIHDLQVELFSLSGWGPEQGCRSSNHLDYLFSLADFLTREIYTNKLLSQAKYMLRLRVLPK